MKFLKKKEIDDRVTGKVEKILTGIDSSIPEDLELPKAKAKLNDDEFLAVLDAIKGVKVPLASIDEFLPYRTKRDRRGNFKGLPGGMDERAKRLGRRLSYNTFEEPETGDTYIQIDFVEMSKKEIDEFMNQRRNRAYRSREKDDDDFKRVKCVECGRRVLISIVDGQILVHCNCEDTPHDAFDITAYLDDDRLEKWKAG